LNDSQIYQFVLVLVLVLSPFLSFGLPLAQIVSQPTIPSGKGGREGGKEGERAEGLFIKGKEEAHGL